LNTGANLWWGATSALSSGKTQGGFDALELLRGEVSDASGRPLSLQVPANATAWFNEFLEVRADWFALLKQQPTTSFTKGLGLSSAKYSLDTPVGLARTYLKATGFTQSNTPPILQALQSGAAVASTGPMLDVTLTAPAGTTPSAPSVCAGNPTAASGRRVFRGVRDEVLDHPLDEGGIGCSRESFLDVEVHHLVAEQAREAVGDSVDQLSKGDIHRFDVEVSGLESSEVEELGQHAVQGCGVRVRSSQEIVALLLGEDVRAVLGGPSRR